MVSLNPDVRNPTVQLACDADLSQDHQEAAVRGVMNGPNIDFKGGFKTSDDDAPRRVGKIHLSADQTDLVAEPHKWTQSSDFPFDPYISIEDEDGNLFDLRNCVPTVETEQFYGAVALDEEGGLWVFKATDPAAELMTADQVRSGEYVPVRLHSQTENCIEQIGYIYDIEGVYDGEFMISKEEQPALVACPWWSEVGLFAPGFGSDEYKKESDELIEAIREGIAIEVQKELDSDAELDQLEP